MGIYAWREPWGWQPWANTVLYMPLTSNLTDVISWTTLDAYSTWWSIWATWWINKNVLYSWTTWSWFYKSWFTWLPTDTDPRTMSIWLKIDTFVPDWGTYASYWVSQGNCVFSLCGRWGYMWFSQMWSNTNDGKITAWTWQNWILTYDGSTLIIYKNGDDVKHWTWTLTTGSDIVAIWIPIRDLTASMGNTWRYSEFIIEDRVWTAQEVTAYYDLTKWDYWITS